MSMPQFLQGLKKLPFQDEKIPVHKIETAYGELSFLMFGETTEFRVRTFFTKEPETLAWIDGFQPGDIFWDIGANIGLYAMYAACRKNLKVFAFEPSPVNFWLLTTSSAVNNFEGRLVTLPFALTDSKTILYFSPNAAAASADNQVLGMGVTAVQTYSIDELIAIQPDSFPNHIKIDVDGIEPLILAGAKNTLKDARLVSLMIEVDEREEETKGSMVELLTQAGFGQPIKRHSPYFDKNHYLPLSNYIFTRKRPQSD